MSGDARDVLDRLEATLRARRDADPTSSYVASLYSKGVAAIAKKVGEESVETIIAALGPERGPLVHEAADLVFHLLVLLAARDVRFDEVLGELARRESLSGLAEKAARGTKQS